MVVRGLLAPAVIALARQRRSGWLMAACILAHTLLDIFDGMAARRLGVATAQLRRMDSAIDTVFFLAVFYAAWLLQPQALRANRVLIYILIVCEAARYIFDSWKFGREASYHMWSAKAWGLLLTAAATALVAFGIAGPLLTAAIVLGIASDIEGLLISALLKESVEDVPHIARAWQLRVAQMRAIGNQSQ